MSQKKEVRRVLENVRMLVSRVTDTIYNSHSDVNCELLKQKVTDIKKVSDSESQKKVKRSSIIFESHKNRDEKKRGDVKKGGSFGW